MDKLYQNMLGGGRINKHVITDKERTLDTSPHYRNPKFQGDDGWGYKDLDTFGEECEGLRYEYMDRMQQWDFDKYDEARKHADELHKRNTCLWFESFLEYYWDIEKVDIKHIRSGVRPYDGYPWDVIGFIDVSENK